MDIPPEIISDILRRLPASSLGRFKTVSKSWLALISEPRFIKDHINTSCKRTHLIYKNKDAFYSLSCNQLEETPKFCFVLPHHNDVFYLHGSCNGLVLGLSYSSLDDDGPIQLVILNPTTNKLFEVPIAGYEMIHNYVKTKYTCGIGYDSLTDDYKVVTLSSCDMSQYYVCVYSLRNNTWRRMMDYPYEHSQLLCSSVVFVDGFLHWIVNKGLELLQVIVAFSLADGTFNEVPSPNLRNDIICKLFVYGEKLAIFQGNEVHVMNEYGVKESWEKIVIHGSEVYEFFDDGVKDYWEISINECRFGTPIAGTTIFYEDDKIMLANSRRMWVYDVEEKSFREIIDTSKDINNLYFHGNYVESLVSPKFS